MKLPPGHVPGLVSQHKATGYGGFGQKMLEKMGWEKGQGLGKEKDGMKDAIEVKKKEDTLGVGANAPTWKWDWKYWEDAYNTGMQSIKKDSSSKKRQRPNSGSGSSDKSTSTSTSSGGSDSDSGSDASSSDSDAAADHATSASESESDTDSDDERAARIAAAVNRDGTTASASVAELRLAADLAKSSSRGPAGRFGGREGKMARIRQQEAQQAAAMAAKLGIVLPAAAAASGNGGKGAAASGSSEDTAAAVASGSRKKQKRSTAAGVAGSSADDISSAAAGKQKKQSKQRTKCAAATDSEEQQQQQDVAAVAAGEPPAKARLVVVVDIKGQSNVESLKAFKPTPASGWWGAKMFASAGLLEGLEQEQKQRQRTTFDEDLQAKVYMAVHDAQRQGKRGIGKRAVKIAGGNWEGKKVTFGEEADEGQQQQQQQEPSAADAAAVGEPKKKKKKKKSCKQQGSQDPQQQLQPQPSSSKEEKQHSTGAKDSSSSAKKSRKAKWAKLAVVQLQGCAGGGQKWKKLWPQLRAAAEEAGVVVSEDAMDQAWQKLQDSRQLLVNGKVVSLAA